MFSFLQPYIYSNGYNSGFSLFSGLAKFSLGITCPSIALYNAPMFLPFLNLNNNSRYNFGSLTSKTNSTKKSDSSKTQNNPLIEGYFRTDKAKKPKDNKFTSFSLEKCAYPNQNVKSKAFLNRVKDIAKRLNCDYKDLLGLMRSESNLNPQAVNKSTGATGLIQIMPTTAKELGTTTAKLKNMTAFKQLDYVEKYLLTVKKRSGFGVMEPLSGGQLYALVFLPARAHREVLTTSNEKYYTSNKGLDANKDGKITKSELDARIKKLHISDSYFVA